MKTIEEGNKLINKFMGWKENEHHWCLNGDKDLQYHKSWDWIMPVVDELENGFGYAELCIPVEITDNQIRVGDVSVNKEEEIVKYKAYKYIEWTEDMTKLDALWAGIVKYLE